MPGSSHVKTLLYRYCVHTGESHKTGANQH